MRFWTLKIMLGDAERLDYVKENVAKRVLPLGEQPAAKTTPELLEARALFAPGSLTKIWPDDTRHYAANLLAATTAMRMGEIQGLRFQDVHHGYLEAARAWGRKHGLLETPKWGSIRHIPIPRFTEDGLAVVIRESPHREIPRPLSSTGRGHRTG